MSNRHGTTTDHELLVVTGMHRSGTTFVGKMFSTLSEIVYLYEPFSFNHGCEGVPWVYPYIDANGNGLTPEFENTIEDVLALRCRYKQKVEDDTLWKAAARRMIRGQGGLSLLKAKVRLMKHPGRQVKLLLKDPFALLTTPYLVRHFDAKVLIIVRHPGAVWKSIKRMGWTDFRFTRFAGPAFWALDENKPYSPDDLEAKKDIERIGYLWKFLYRNVERWQRKHPDNVHLIKHEELCLEPERSLRRIADFFQVTVTREFLEGIEKNTKSENVAARGNKLHDLQRDSRRLAWSWIRSVPGEEEAILKNITEDTVYALYGKWR